MKEAFKDYFRDLIGDDEAEQFFDSIKLKQTRRGLRVNTLRTSVDSVAKWLSSQGYTVTPSPFCKEGLEIEGRGIRLALKLPYHAGFTYPQDPSSMFAVDLLDPQPGETVLDLTAAPGGKTTHIAQRMENTGVLLANDMDTRRLRALHSNLERLGIWNTVVTRMMAHKLTAIYPETFDRILLDPSCGGEGLLVTRDGKPKYWSLKSMNRYTTDQFSLLCSAFTLLKPGGRLVYSTCTLNQKENDDVADRLLKKFPQAAIEDIKVPHAPKQIAGLKGIRFWPHKTGTKGFFCIAITKTESLELEVEEPPREHLKALNAKQSEPFLRELKDHFGVELPGAHFVMRDQHLFRVSEALLKFPLLPFYSLSFPVLKSYEHELRPTHAGAQWLALQATNGVVELDYEQAKLVFERQRIANDSEERGLFLARYDDFPLGVTKLTEKGVEVLLPRQH